MTEKWHQDTVDSWASLSTQAPELDLSLIKVAQISLQISSPPLYPHTLLLSSPVCSGLVISELLDDLLIPESQMLIPSAQKCLSNVIFWHHLSPLTVVPQSFVNEPCSRDEERLQTKLRMVCSFHAAVFHLKVAVKLLTCVDVVAARCSIQHVSHSQRRQCGYVSSHRSADSHAHRCRII